MFVIRILSLLFIVVVSTNKLYADEAYPVGTTYSKIGEDLMQPPLCNLTETKYNCAELKKFPYRCLLINDRGDFLSAGSYFSVGKNNYYQLILNTSYGAALIVKSSSDENLTKFYLAVSVYSTCDDLIFDFFPVDTTDQNTISYPNPSPSEVSKIRLKLKYFYSDPSEGEFRLPDLKGRASGVKDKINEDIVLLRAMRYSIPKIFSNAECANQLEEMSKEVCRALYKDSEINYLVDGKINDNSCSSLINGENEKSYKDLKKSLSEGKLNKYNKRYSRCPN